MFFSDGVDPSSAGFASIFTSNAGDSSPDVSPETDSQDGATAADSFAPEATADEQDLSAEDVVAARFAASLAEDGVDLSDSDDETDETDTDEGPSDVEKLSPEELQARVKEFEDFKAEQAKSNDAAQLQAVEAKAFEAEQTAIAQVWQEYEREVLTKSAEWYRAELTKRVAGIERASMNQDDPATYRIQSSISAAFTVFAAQQEYERKKEQEWAPIAQQARIEARQNSPEVREFVARHLVKTLGLPEEAVADIASPNRHILSFEHRAQELVDMAKHAGTERKKQKLQRQKDANRKLQTQPVRTSSTGKLPGGKPPEYKGTQDEFVKIMRFGSGT